MALSASACPRACTTTALTASLRPTGCAACAWCHPSCAGIRCLALPAAAALRDIHVVHMLLCLYGSLNVATHCDRQVRTWVAKCRPKGKRSRPSSCSASSRWPTSRWLTLQLQRNVRSTSTTSGAPLIGIRDDPDLATDPTWAPLGSPQVCSCAAPVREWQRMHTLTACAMHAAPTATPTTRT